MSTNCRAFSTSGRLTALPAFFYNKWRNGSSIVEEKSWLWEGDGLIPLRMLNLNPAPHFDSLKTVSI